MGGAEGLLSALEWNWGVMDAALHDLDEATLGRRPAEQCNSIAWTLWHANRVVDGFIHTRLQALPQLWVSAAWHQRFGMSDNPDERGVGWTREQVDAWTAPSKDIQVGYYEAVKQAARAYLSTLSNADLEVTRVIPPLPTPRTVAAAIGQMTWDNISHGGQIAYIRGLFSGMGWYAR